VDICIGLIATDICAIVIGFSAGKPKENDLKYWFPVIELVYINFIKNIFKTSTLETYRKKKRGSSYLPLLLE
jgi:hypothetical protein